MHAALAQAEDQAGRRVRVYDIANFRAASCPRLVLPMEKAHGAASEVAVAAAMIGLQVVRRRERRDVAEAQRRRVQRGLVLAAVVSFLVLLAAPHVQVKKSLAAMLVPKFPKIPAEVIPTIVEFWAHAGDY